MVSPKSPSPQARALHLGGRDHKTVSCTAEALVVRNALNQTRRYPLVRISRIFASAAASDWSGEALALCLRQGVSITWVDSRGEALGTAFPSSPAAPTYVGALESILAASQGVDLYANWLRSRRMEVLKQWGKICSHSIEPSHWQRVKHDWVYGGKFETHLPRGLRSHCLAWAGAQLAQFGLPPILWDALARPVPLQDDLCTLQWAEMNLCAGSLGDTIDETEALTALFERSNTVHGAGMPLHIASLCRMALQQDP